MNEQNIINDLKQSWKGSLTDLNAHGTTGRMHTSDTLKNLLWNESITKCPYCFYAIQKNALEKNNKDAIRSVLRHCFAADTEFIFIELRPHGIKREELVKDIAHKFLYVETSHFPITLQSRQYYRQKIFEWFIRRYAWWNAVKAIWRSGLPLPTCINLIYPRFLGGIIIGFLPLVPESSVWKLAAKYGITSSCDPVPTLVLIIVTLVLVFMYIYYECFKLIQSHCKTFFRSLGTLLLGCIYSLGVFGFIYWPLMKVEPEYVLQNDFWLYAPFFCPAALLVGVFLQFFWEEKTITEPL